MFVKEDFNLYGGIFQPAIDTDTEGGGTVHQDETYGYIQTFANADAAIIVTNEGLTKKELFNTPFRISLSYELTSLPDGDVIRTFYLTQKATQPEIGSLGTVFFQGYLLRSGAAYYERWRYIAGAVEYTYDGSIPEWDNNTTENVREDQALNTEYSLEITWHPELKRFYIENDDGDAAFTDEMPDLTSDPVWLVVGDIETVNYYGQLKLYNLYVESLLGRRRWQFPNSICTSQRYRNNFGGSFMIFRNDITTQQRERHIFKNDILDYQPVRKRHHFCNRIGQMVLRQSLPLYQVYLDEGEISKGVESWRVSYRDDWFCKQADIRLRDGSVISDLSPRLPGDEGYKDPRIDIYAGSVKFFEGFWEDFGEDTASGDLTGRSLTAIGDRPFAEKVTGTIEEAITKKDFAESLMPDVNIIWNIINTVIPANHYSYDDLPINIIREMVEACGGVLVTDKDENLIAEYHEYGDLDQKTPVATLTSSEITRASYQRIVGTGENSVIVMGSAQERVYGQWPTITIVLSKDHLRSDGNDKLKVTVWCRNGDGTYQDVEEITDEEVTCDTDPYSISVSKTIKRVIGVWENDGGSHGDIVAGPYEIDGTTIKTTGVMQRDGEYLVSYVGGLTCSLSVDQLAELKDTSLLIEAGFVETELLSSSGGGGLIKLTASWTDGGGATATDTDIIILDDPRVGAIDAAANPSSLERDEPSEITVRVYDNEGNPVDDGFEVFFALLEGAIGALSDDSALTTTSTITDETHISSSQSDLSTRFPIDTLISIYRYKIVSGINIPYTDINYADFATVEGSTIKLSGTVLPEAETPYLATYTSGGTAQITYTAPSSITSGGTSDMISCRAGAENKIVTIELQAPAPGQSERPSAGRTFEKRELHFLGTFTGKYGEGEGFAYQTYTKEIPKKDGYLVKVYNEISDMTGSQAEYIKGVDVFHGNLFVYVVLTVLAHRVEHVINSVFGDGYLIGRLQVITEDTSVPVAGAVVEFYWDGSEVPTEVDYVTDAKGYADYTRGKVGSTKVRVIPPQSLIDIGYEILETTYTIDKEVLNNPLTPIYYEFLPVDFSVKVPWKYLYLGRAY